MSAIRRYSFPLLEINSRTVLSKEFLRANSIEDFLWMPEFRADRDYAFGHLVLSLRSWVLQSRHVETREITMEAPATWFDHLKEHIKQDVQGQRVVGKRLWYWFTSKISVRRVVHKRAVETSTFVCPHVGSTIEKDQKHLEFLLHTCDDSPIRY